MCNKYLYDKYTKNPIPTPFLDICYKKIISCQDYNFEEQSKCFNRRSMFIKKIIKKTMFLVYLLI